MGHPLDRRHRWNIAVKIGLRRAIQLWIFHKNVRQDDEVVVRDARALRHITKICSCASCGNQRQWQGITLQERKHLDASKVDSLYTGGK